MRQEGPSPLTGRIVSSMRLRTDDGDLFNSRTLIEINDAETIGQWYVSASLLEAGFMRDSQSLRLTNRTLDRSELKKLLALAASKIWKESRSEKRWVAVLDNAWWRYADERKYFESEGWKNLIPLKIEDIWTEARDLLFETKALITLNNIVNSEVNMGDGIKVFDGSSSTTGEKAALYEGTEFTGGIAYGAVDAEARLIFEFLNERKWTRSSQVSAKRSDVPAPQSVIHMSVTPTGYMMNDRVRIGISDVTKAFLVCRFTPKLDAIYDAVYDPIGKDPDLKCPIQRVKDIHHVDKVTDKIVQEINEATIVVVDLTEDNFNVAFEAGYALALGKPIVWCVSEKTGEVRFPFDIQAENILIYDPNDLDKFRSMLKPRVLAALSKARRGSIPLFEAKRLVGLVGTS